MGRAIRMSQIERHAHDRQARRRWGPLAPACQNGEFSTSPNCVAGHASYCHVVSRLGRLRQHVTLPPTPISSPVVPSQTDSSVVFPISWILKHGASPVQYRALTNVARLSNPPARLLSLVYSYYPGPRLAISQQVDGIWNRSMLSVPLPGSNNFEGVGTITAFRRLLELGWEKDSPPMLSGRRILFRLLAEDNDPTFLFEFGADARVPELRSRGRLILREAAAAALAQAGYESDPRLRGCAQRIVRRVGDFLASPLAADPWVRIGNKHVLAPEASPPSIHLLTMLAHMPHFQSEHQHFMALLFDFLSRPLPRQESQQALGSHIVAQSHFVLGDQLATRNMVDGDVPSALNWLELMARLGFLRRNEHWERLFQRFLGERNRDAVWRPGKGVLPLPSAAPDTWPMYPLDTRAESNAVAAEVTLRLGIIARASGRTLELV